MAKLIYLLLKQTVNSYSIRQDSSVDNLEQMFLYWPTNMLTGLLEAIEDQDFKIKKLVNIGQSVIKEVVQDGGNDGTL